MDNAQFNKWAGGYWKGTMSEDMKAPYNKMYRDELPAYNAAMVAYDTKLESASVAAGSEVFGPTAASAAAMGLPVTGFVAPAPAAAPMGPAPAAPMGLAPAAPMGLAPAAPMGLATAAPMGLAPAAPLGLAPAAPMGLAPAAPMGLAPAAPVGLAPAAPMGPALAPAAPMGPAPSQ